MIRNYSRDVNDMNDKKQRFYSANEIAELLNVPASAVRRWVRIGKLKGFYLGNGRTLRVLGSDLEAYLSQSQKASSKESAE